VPLTRRFPAGSSKHSSQCHQNFLTSAPKEPKGERTHSNLVHAWRVAAIGSFERDKGGLVRETAAPSMPSKSLESPSVVIIRASWKADRCTSRFFYDDEQQARAAWKRSRWRDVQINSDQVLSSLSVFYINSSFLAPTILTPAHTSHQFKFNFHS